MEAINVRHYDGVPVPFVILNVDFVEGLRMRMYSYLRKCRLNNGRFNDDGNREVDPEKELTELELSGIKEIMNQMMGHAATAMSEMFQEKWT